MTVGLAVAVCLIFSRLNEIRVLKVRLADMRRELHVLRTGVANVDVLKREVSVCGDSPYPLQCKRESNLQ